MLIFGILSERGKFCMDKEYYMALAKVRMERAKELINELKEFLCY